jgi:RNA polymerase sigma factor (sigma-70 family)
MGANPMNGNDWLTERFQEHRTHLRAVAYRMLGSMSEADDAVQEAWLRLNRTGADGIDNLGGWLTTVVSRVCLNMLRSRGTRREEPLSTHVPDPIVTRENGADPESDALMADAVGLALHVVLETLTPPERLAFVLHDMFAVPFEDIATIVDRSPDAARQLASRARRRVQGAAAPPDPDVARQREVVNAFFAAARAGDFEALVAVLDPDVVVRTDGGEGRRGLSRLVRGADKVARGAMAYARAGAELVPVLVNGAAGVVVVADGEVQAVLGFTVTNGKVVAVDSLADPDRLRQLDLAGVVGIGDDT